MLNLQVSIFFFYLKHDLLTYLFYILFRHARVPDVLLTTIEIPDGVQITGRGCFLQAQVCRTKRDLKSESNAKEISDGLPFLEYELHRLLINKLKARGMNACFGLKVYYYMLI